MATNKVWLPAPWKVRITCDKSEIHKEDEIQHHSPEFMQKVKLRCKRLTDISEGRHGSRYECRGLRSEQKLNTRDGAACFGWKTHISQFINRNVHTGTFLFQSRFGDKKRKIEGTKIGSCMKNQMIWSFYINKISQNCGLMLVFKNTECFL